MSETTEVEAQLTLKDRLNYPYLLGNQFLTFQKALLALEYSEREVRETIEGFVHMIPTDWKDKQFKKDVEEATEKVKVDVRPLVAGTTKLSAETCEKLGIPAEVEEVQVDYYAVFQACVDLLARRGMMSKREYTEMMTGKPFNQNEPIVDA